MTFEQFFLALILASLTIAIAIVGVLCLISNLKSRKKVHRIICTLIHSNSKNDKFLFIAKLNDGTIKSMVMYLDSKVLEKSIPEAYFVEDKPLDAYTKHLLNILQSSNTEQSLRIGYKQKGKNKYIVSAQVK